MDSTTINILIGGLIGVSGTLLGSLVNGYYNRKNLKTQLLFNKDEANRKLILENLEILHSSLGFCLNASANFIAQMQLLPINNEGLKLYTQICDELLQKYTTAFTKLRIYAPEVIPEWEILMLCLKANFQISQKLMTDKSRFIADLADNHNKIVDIIKVINVEIEKKIEKINNSGHSLVKA